jgi:hypothetical protein
VNTEQIRQHARNVAALQARFGAVKAASAHIAGDESAYGLLCGWIAAVLEGRHKRQDELIAYAEENLALAVDGLQLNAERYEAVEADTMAAARRLGGRV